MICPAGQGPDLPETNLGSGEGNPVQKSENKRRLVSLPTGQKDPLFHSRMIRPAGRGPDLSETIEGYPQRPKKRNPRRATKDDEGPLRGWRKLKRDPPKVGRGEEISTKGAKGSVKGTKDESAKGSQGVGKDSKGVHEGPRRTLRFSTNAHSIIEPVSFLCSSFSSCLSCLSRVSMFNDAANRINGTWPLLLIGIRKSIFWSAARATRSV